MRLNSKPTAWFTGPLAIMLLMNLLVADAQTLRTTLKDLVESAGTVVTGRVVDVREGRHPEYANVTVTFVTMEVEETLKGHASHQRRHTFMQFGGLVASRVQELPSHRTGEDVVLFLYPESQYGFTSPVGGNQGKFYVRTDPQTGERIVANAMNNAKLFEGIVAEKLSPAERQMVRNTGGAVDYPTFASLVRKLAQGPVR